MIEEEVDRMRVKGGTLTEPETIENEENVLNILFTECDADGNSIEGGIEKENSVILKYFTPGVQAELKGKTKDSFIVTQLAKGV
jgi:trigger factor